MKKCLLTAAAALVLGGSMTVSAEKWVQLTNMKRVNCPVEVVIGYVYDGHITQEEIPTQAPAFADEETTKVIGDAGVPFTGVMTTGFYQAWSGTYLNSSYFGCAVVSEEAVEELEEMPANAAMLRLDKAAEGYTLYMTNGTEGVNVVNGEAGANGYLRPAYMALDSKRSINGLCVFDEPLTCGISGGLIRFDQNERNLLTYTKQPFSAAAPEGWVKNSKNSILCFSSMQQREGEGKNVIFVRESDLLEETAECTITPANGSFVESFEDLVIELNFGEDVTSVSLSDNATTESISALWNGESWASPSSSFRGNPIMFSYRDMMPLGNGVYELNIAAGTFEVTYEDGKTLLSDPISYKLNVGEEPIPFNVTPKDGATVETLYRLQFNFGSGSGITAIESAEEGVYGSMTFNGENYDIDGFLPNANLPYRFDLTFVEITEAGTLAWTIQPGTFKLTYEDGTVKTNTFMSGSVILLGEPPVKQNLIWETDPALDATVIAPQSVTVTLPQASEIMTVNANAIDVMFGEDYENIEFTLGDIKGNTFAVNFNEPIDQDGEVTVMFYEQAVKLVLEDGTRVYSPEYAVTFNAEKKVPQVWSIVSPEAGNYDQYPTVVIKYEDCTAVAVNEGAKATLTVGTAGSAELDIVAGDEPGEVKFVPTAPIELYVSDYTKNNLVVPADSYKLTISGKQVANDELTIDQFKINNPAARLAKCTLEPAPGNQGRAILAEITVNVISPIAALNVSLKKITLNKVNEDGSVTKVGNMTATSGNIAEDKMSFKMSYSAWDTLEEGDYRITFPKDSYYVLVDGKRTGCPEQSFDYHLTTVVSVNEVSAADDSNDVYTVTGICVGLNLDKEALKALPQGLYIVNGKKTIVR